MSQCVRCGISHARGLNDAGWCIHCCYDEDIPFALYSGRRPENGDRQAGGCPQCGWPLDGVFLCVGCEQQADNELRGLAINEEWERHVSERPRHFRATKTEWTAINDALEGEWVVIEKEANRELP